MKKKVVIYYLIIRSAVRLGAAAFLALDGVVALPYAVYLPTIAMAAGELGVTVWYFAKYITRQKLAFVLGLDTLLTLWNIVVLSVITVSVSAAETMVCGTFLDVLLNLVLLVLVLKGRKYVVIQDPKPRRTRRAIEAKRAKKSAGTQDSPEI